MTSLSRTTIYRFMRGRNFPHRVRLSPNRVAWKKEELKTWIQIPDFEPIPTPEPKGK